MAKQDTATAVQEPTSTVTGNNNQIHVFANGKGGIGKSWTASAWAQYGASIGKPVTIFDGDDQNRSLARLNGLNAREVNLRKSGELNHLEFDKLVKEMESLKGPYLWDFGASVFGPAWSHIVDHGYLEFWESQGHNVTVHTIITGGDDMANTVAGFEQIAKMVPGRNVVLWVNRFDGDVVMDGKPWNEFKSYKAVEDKLVAVIELPDQGAVIKSDLKLLGQKQGIMLGVENNADLSMIQRHRVARFRDALFQQIQPVWEAIDGKSAGA